MTAHDHARFVHGCYRCDLNKDEINGWIESLVVTRNRVVHNDDCRFANAQWSSAKPWLPNRDDRDRGCRECLSAGLPERVL